MGHPKGLRTAAAISFLAVAAVGLPALAQPGPGGPETGSGIMMGPGMMGGRGFRFLCNPRMAGFAEWRLARIEDAVKPTEAQKAALNELKSASTKAAEIISSGCPATLPAKPTERLEFAEKRLEAMQQAIKIVRPAFETFYNSLDDKQKASLEAIGPRSWGWRAWRWHWSAK